MLRADLAVLVADAVATEGIRSVHLTTNGLLLTERASELRDAGLTGLNISLDTLRADRFDSIVRGPGLSRTRRSHRGFHAVREGIQIALDLAFPSVKVNVVVMRGVNDDEIESLANLARGAPLTVRFIELMPFDAGQVWKRGCLVEAGQIVETLVRTFPDLQPCEGSPTEHHVFRVPGHQGKVAVIPAYTRSFCGQCRRIRVTADGKVMNCLYAMGEQDVTRMLRSAVPDEAVAAAFQEAVATKRKNGWEARKAASENNTGVPLTGDRDSMTLIGG